ncbi:MAG TPA: STAS domain-containing protein [Spirochaetia bacterium]|nr:STAS domain-containing protein [Spirochaetia bacterium]
MSEADLGVLEASTCSMKHFAARARDRGEQGGLVIQLEGYFDGDAAMAVTALIVSLIENWKGYPQVSFDLARVSYISSLGIGALTSARSAALQRGLRFSVDDPQPAVLNVLELLGMTTYLSIRTSRREE